MHISIDIGVNGEPSIHMVRVAMMAGFDQQVRQLMGDPAAILRDQGLPSGYFVDHSQGQLLTYDQADELLHAASVATSCPHFSILLGTQQNKNLSSVIRLVMHQSSDVGTALQALCDHPALHVASSASLTLEVFGNQACLSYKNSSISEHCRYSEELALSQTMIMFKALCGGEWAPAKVSFRHQSPHNISAYLDIFASPVHFAQSETQIHFAKTWLDLPIRQSDPALNMILQTHSQQSDDAGDQGLCSDIADIIRELLPTGQFSIEQVADLRAVHPRTLQRMLKKEGKSFSGLLESVRREIATERLLHSDISIIQLSDYLGYADNTAFTRAFRRWYGSAPMQWRKSTDTDL